jgi:uncharacterized DUF497 family protein
LAIIWDPEKLKSNIAKHGVRFSDAIPVFEDPGAITIADLVVVYAWSGSDIRLISARLANPHERQEYENR